MDAYHDRKESQREVGVPRKSINQGARALSRALNRLVDHGVIPAEKHTDYLGQASVFLNQATQAIAVLRSSTRAMMNSFDEDGGAPWDWFLLHQDDEIRCGVLAVSPYRPVPVHDHPGASGILLVLEGHLVERSYQLDSSTEPGTGLVRLVPGETHYLDAGQWDVYMSDWNNLHSLSAIGRPAMALSIQFHPGSEQARSWFLTTGKDAGEAPFAIRTHQAMLNHRTV